MTLLWILVGNGFIRHYPLLSTSDSNMPFSPFLIARSLLIVLLLSHFLLLASSYFLKLHWCHEIAIPWFLPARLVIKGCAQKWGEDYKETYSPVASFVSLRVLLAIINRNNLYAHQVDAKNAFYMGV
jgi:hypothetical protein